MPPYESLFKKARGSPDHQRLARSGNQVSETLRHSLSCWHTTGQQQELTLKRSLLASRWAESHERSAHVEAIAHLRQGLALLATLPEDPTASPARSEHV